MCNLCVITYVRVRPCVYSVQTSEALGARRGRGRDETERGQGARAPEPGRPSAGHHADLARRVLGQGTATLYVPPTRFSVSTTQHRLSFTHMTPLARLVASHLFFDRGLCPISIWRCRLRCSLTKARTYSPRPRLRLLRCRRRHRRSLRLPRTRSRCGPPEAVPDVP
jgi:hypothetical protein